MRLTTSMVRSNANYIRPAPYPEPRVSLQSRSSLLPVLVTALAMYGFQCASFFDIGLPRFVGWGPGVSLALFAMTPMLLYSLPWMTLPMGTWITRLPIVFLAAFFMWCLLRFPLSPDIMFVRNITTPLGMLLIPCGTAAIFYKFWPAMHRALPIIIYVTVISFNAWVAASFSFGLIVEAAKDTADTDVLTQYAISGMLSTQFALYVGIQLCYCLFLLRTKRGIRLLTLALIALSCYNIVAISASRGAILGVGIVFILYIFQGSFTRQVRMASLAGILLFMAAGVLAPYIASLIEKTETLIHQEERENIRVTIYQDVWAHALQNPILGMGLEGYYTMTLQTNMPCVPHQNILGLACDTGFPGAIFYLLFVITATIAIWVRPPQKNTPKLVADAKYFIMACLWIFLYLQVRGLAADTWTMKEMYFCVGAGLGLRLWLQKQAVYPNHPQVSTKGIALKQR